MHMIKKESAQKNMKKNCFAEKKGAGEFKTPIKQIYQLDVLIEFKNCKNNPGNYKTLTSLWLELSLVAAINPSNFRQIVILLKLYSMSKLNSLQHYFKGCNYFY